MKNKKEKKIVTLEKYHKTKLIGSLCSFFTALILIISNGILEMDTPLWFITLIVLAIIPFFVCSAMEIVWEAEKRVEKHDELSLQMLNKAHLQMFKSFSGLLIIILIVSMFWKGSVKINVDGNMLFIIFMCLYSFYNACESSFFLRNEKKLSYEGEDRDE